MKGRRYLLKQEIQNLAQSFNGEYKIRNRSLFLLYLTIGEKTRQIPLNEQAKKVWGYQMEGI